MPRRYTLGRRATAVARTRQRIIEAAAGLYRVQGVSRTSMAQVAREADLAPGTVANHFGSADELAAAVAHHLQQELRSPQPTIFDGLHTMEDRIRRLSRELASFYQRSECWYEVYRAEGGRVPAWEKASAAFYQEIDALIRMALGPLARDGTAVAVVTAVLNPSVSGALRWQGMDGEAAGDLLADVLLPWLRLRGAPRQASGRSTRS